MLPRDLKVGDIVRIRDGRIGEVEEITNEGVNSVRIQLTEKGSNPRDTDITLVSLRGEWLQSYGPHDKDVVEIAGE